MLYFLANFLQVYGIFCIFVQEKAGIAKIGAVFSNKMKDLLKTCGRA